MAIIFPLFIFFLLHSPSIFSLKTTTFHVSSSLHQIRTLFSHSQNSLPDSLLTRSHTTNSLQTTPSQLILPLHPHFSLYKPTHKNYTLLTLSRLARDSVRVNSLYTKLGHDSVRVNSSNSFTIRKSLKTPVTSGVKEGSGEYFTRIGIGTPAKQYYMVIDTGSDVNWIQCQPCSDCYEQSDPIFDPTQSSTYKTIACNSPQCNSLDISSCRVLTDTCLYQVDYGDGSITVGDLATETVSFGLSGTVPNVAIGCGHQNQGLFAGAAGLIGLGGTALSLPSQINAKTISYCLVNRDSLDWSTLEFNSVSPSHSVTAPLWKNHKLPTFFYVGMAGIRVGDEDVALPKGCFEINKFGQGGIILDSGTAVTRLTTRVYNSVRDSFAKAASHLPSSSSFELFDTCYDLSKFKKIEVPTVSFLFVGGDTLMLKTSNYLIPVDGKGKYCFAFAPTPRSLSIIGNIQQQGTRVTYDIARSLVSFSPNEC